MALTEARRTGEFILSEANGTRSREAVTIAAAAGALPAGTVMGKITASGKYVEYDNTVADGTEVAAGVLYAAVADSASDQPAVIIARDAEVANVHLTWDAANNAGAITAGKADLAALGIIVR